MKMLWNPLWKPFFAQRWVRLALAPVALTAAASWSGVAVAQPFPNRPIKLMVPFTPGGGTDILARIVAQKMGDALGQPVVVDNRPGGNTLVATELLVRAPAQRFA